ncbi:hypothetical protein D6D17_04045 [Aureobasidium pullulans]|nr:hypothetical protein D6D17_04045 [Aureobasidium pullulans]THX88945.1 hypothetical protein D6D08_03920 [Aureobasidium pullulans]TIA79176.1 hypothetical protein D6C76_03704 [Aureobasidium pullulans]
MSDVDYHGIFPGSSLFYTGTTPSPTKDEHQHVELVDEDVLGPDDPIPTPLPMPGVIWTVELHNIFKISLVVRREALSIKLSVEGCTDLKNIVHFYRSLAHGEAVEGPSDLPEGTPQPPTTIPFIDLRVTPSIKSPSADPEKPGQSLHRRLPSSITGISPDAER